MGKSSIVVRGVYKRYFRHLKKSLSLRETLQKTLSKGPGPAKQEFWALKDIDLRVEEGEILGIIGKNGAGKSTLLKVLARITRPTRGRIELNGTVASLLEVGTGFHYELTGRENIFLNGSILGMKRSDIRKKFDQILEFSGVEEFIDTPLKHYSSGMALRLAFSVAAHLSPQILLVDEVLAVGDAEFQKKCLGKMNEVARGGRTVLLVSHNLAEIRKLCTRCILLDGGEIILEGPPSLAIDQYLADLHDRSKATIKLERPAEALIWGTTLTTMVNGIESSSMEFGDELSFLLGFRSSVRVKQVIIGIVISSKFGEVLNANNLYQMDQNLGAEATQGVIQCHLGKVPLMNGIYNVSFWLGSGKSGMQVLERVLQFEVSRKDIWGKGNYPPEVSALWWDTQIKITGQC